MKKITDFERYRRNQERARRRNERQRHRHRGRGSFSGVLRKSQFVALEGEATRLIAPRIFSLMQNPEDSLEFFDNFERACRDSPRIIIDTSRVEIVTVEALLLLLANIKRSSQRCGRIGGNEPTNAKVRKIFAQSGFYDFFAKQPRAYQKQHNTGLLKRREGKRVRESVCAELVHYTSIQLFGTKRKNGGLYRALIECMANTRDHAKIGVSDPEAWWVTVFYDDETHIAHFAFLDTGVGIFKSARLQGFLKQLGRFFNVVTRPDVLVDILDANLGSRTNLPYRGKGLPSIRRALDRKQIRNLKILTNDALLDATSRKGITLDHSFRGTCLTWEIHRD